MENATKALLIAAAVLIAILLIAFGMKIFTSTKSSTEQTKQVGEAINAGTEKAAKSLAKATPELTIQGIFNVSDVSELKISSGLEPYIYNISKGNIKTLGDLGWNVEIQATGYNQASDNETFRVRITNKNPYKIKVNSGS